MGGVCCAVILLLSWVGLLLDLTAREGDRTVFKLTHFAENYDLRVLTVLYCIARNNKIRNVTSGVENLLHNCTTQQLELLNYICTHYESFALVTFETYLIVTMFILKLLLFLCFY